MLPGCDCCEVDGQLVEDGATWIRDSKTFECCRGEIVIKVPSGNVAGTFFRVVNEHGAIFNVSATYTNSVCDDQAEITNTTFGEFAEFPDDKFCGPYVTINASSVLGSRQFECSTTTMYKFPNVFIKPSYEFLESKPKVTSGPGLFPGCYFDTRSSDRSCPEVGVSCIDDSIFNQKIRSPSLYECSKHIIQKN